MKEKMKETHVNMEVWELEDEQNEDSNIQRIPEGKVIANGQILTRSQRRYTAWQFSILDASARCGERERILNASRK